MYLHGRCKDLSPIIVANMAVIGRMIEEEDLCAESFCNLHSFITGYMMMNMLVPGQVDRWVIIIDNSQFSLLNMPIGMFRQAARDMSNNFLE